MINRTTVDILGLKPVTRSMCRGLFVKINTECDTPGAIKESVSWWQDDKEKLHRLWWVLNYYSERLDPDRNLRACVEKQLDLLAMASRPDAFEESKPDRSPEPETDHVDVLEL